LICGKTEIEELPIEKPLDVAAQLGDMTLSDNEDCE